MVLYKYGLDICCVGPTLGDVWPGFVMITGFPSPAQGYEEKGIDLNSLLIPHPSATVLMQIQSRRYASIGLYEGDLAIVDRSLDPQQDSIVVYEWEGEFRMGRLGKISGVGRELFVFGVVSYVLHPMDHFGGGG